jgi:hypothetical protein
MILIPFMGERFIFPDVYYFVDFLVEFLKKFPDQGIMKEPESFREAMKEKYDALVMKEGEIVALKHSSRKVNGIYPIKEVARGREDVAKLIFESDLKKNIHNPMFIRTEHGFVRMANG